MNSTNLLSFTCFRFAVLVRESTAGLDTPTLLDLTTNSKGDEPLIIVGGGRVGHNREKKSKRSRQQEKKALRRRGKKK